MSSGSEDHEQSLDDSLHRPPGSDAKPSKRMGRRAMLGWTLVVSTVSIPLFQLFNRRSQGRASVLVELDDVGEIINTRGTYSILPDQYKDAHKDVDEYRSMGEESNKVVVPFTLGFEGMGVNSAIRVRFKWLGPKVAERRVRVQLRAFSEAGDVLFQRSESVSDPRLKKQINVGGGNLTKVLSTCDCSFMFPKRYLYEIDRLELSFSEA